MSECVCPCVSSPARKRSKVILARRAKHKSNSCLFFLQYFYQYMLVQTVTEGKCVSAGKYNGCSCSLHPSIPAFCK